MMLLIYIIGAIVAMLIFAYIIYSVDGYLTLEHLAMAVFGIFGSWVSVVIVGVAFVDWKKKIWERKK